VNDADVWSAVIDERTRLADELEGLDADAWDRPTRAAGWRVREVVGHLVWLAERSRRQLLTDNLGSVRLDRGVDRIARRYGEAPGPELARRLRAAAGGQGRGPFLPPATVLGEVRTHRADLAGAVGLAPRPADDGLRAVLGLYRRIPFAFKVPRAVRRLRLEPDGAGWWVGPDDGPVVRGPADEVLLAVAGRPADVEGDGVAALRR
jgi:uncharacterized protein (TIGR03083 family)